MTEESKPTKALDIDAIEARQKAANPGGALLDADAIATVGLGNMAEEVRNVAKSAADVPALVAEVRRLRDTAAVLESDVGRLHEQRTKLLGVIGDLVKLCPESAEAVFALTDIIMAGDPATERRDA